MRLLAKRMLLGGLGLLPAGGGNPVRAIMFSDRLTMHGEGRALWIGRGLLAGGCRRRGGHFPQVTFPRIGHDRSFRNKLMAPNFRGHNNDKKIDLNLF